MIVPVSSEGLNGYTGVMARMTSTGSDRIMNVTIGIDVSKDALDACRSPEGTRRRFTNTPAGHRQLIVWIGNVCRIVYEPTGPYHRAMEAALDAAGLPLCKVNPRQARRFAEACGELSKTDRIDAEVLARMGQALDLAPRPVADEQMACLQELLAARRALVRDRTACLNRQKQLSLALLRRQAAARIRKIERDIDAVNAAMNAQIARNPGLARRFAILASIPGIGEQAAFALIIEMPELGTIEPKAAAALAGLAPRVRQSGKQVGRAVCRGGRKPLRDALYMPALVAARFNPNMREKYRELIAAGKPPKVAITAVMRKLLVLANVLLAQDRKWVARNA